jgi:hypothetical protein
MGATGCIRSPLHGIPARTDSRPSSAVASSWEGCRHLSVRLIEVNWLRTQLPNSTTNIQNDLELGAGIVFHTAQD